MNETPDIELLCRGDMLTFKKFFEHYYPILMSFSCRFVERQVSEDLVQEVFINVWEKRDSLKTDNTLSFLLKSVQNKCLDYLKHKSIVESYESQVRIAGSRMEYIMERTDNNQIYTAIDRKELYEELKSAISKLPSKCAQACELYYFQGYSTKEIAVMMDVSSRTIEGYFYQAVKFLKDELRDTNLLELLMILEASHFLS